MPRKPALSVVKPGSPEPPAAKLTVSQAAESGVRRDLLVAMRDRIARTVESPDCPPRDLAALTRRLVEIAREIESIDLAERQEAERGGRVEDEAFDASAV